MPDAETSEVLKTSGLSVKEIEALRSVFRKNPSVTKAILFGSRAKGTAKPYSDIDIAVEGPKNDLEAEKISMQLDELPLPYKFDVKLLSSIQHDPLREHIRRAGITLYSTIAP